MQLFIDVFPAGKAYPFASLPITTKKMSYIISSIYKGRLIYISCAHVLPESVSFVKTNIKKLRFYRFNRRGKKNHLPIKNVILGAILLRQEKEIKQVKPT